MENKFENWQVRTLTDAYREREPLPYIVDGTFSLPSLNMVFGREASLKSLLVADLGACIASGQSWLQPCPSEVGLVQPVRVQQWPVLWLDFDNGQWRTEERIEAVSKGHGLRGNEPFYYMSMPEPQLDIGNGAHIGQLTAMVMDRGIRFVVIDNLACVTGQFTEMDAEIRQVISSLRTFVDRTGVAVILIHHGNKRASKRAGDNARGRTELLGGLDVSLQVERDGESDTVTISPTKQRGPKIDNLGAEFSYEHRPGTSDLAAARFWGKNLTGTPDRLTILAVIVKYADGCIQAELVKRVRGELPTAPTNVIRNIANNSPERIRIEPGARGAKQYFKA